MVKIDAILISDIGVVIFIVGIVSIIIVRLFSGLPVSVRSDIIMGFIVATILGWMLMNVTDTGVTDTDADTTNGDLW